MNDTSKILNIQDSKFDTRYLSDISLLYLFFRLQRPEDGH